MYFLNMFLQEETADMWRRNGGTKLESWKLPEFFLRGVEPLCTIWQGTSSDFMATFWQVYPQQTCQKANFC